MHRCAPDDARGYSFGELAALGLRTLPALDRDPACVPDSDCVGAAGISIQDDLSELKAKMGMLGGNSTSTKQLSAGDEPEATSPAGEAAPVASSPTAEESSGSLSAEDLKELEDLDLSGVDMDELKAELQDLERQMADIEGGDGSGEASK